MVDGEKRVMARLAAKGDGDADLRKDIEGASGCVSRRPCHFWAVSLGDIKKRKIWSLLFTDALLRADVFGRDVLLRAPHGMGPIE